MGFWRGVKNGLRREGLWLDAEQACAILELARCARDSFPALTAKEENLLRRFEKRCEELKR